MRFPYIRYIGVYWGIAPFFITKIHAKIMNNETSKTCPALLKKNLESIKERKVEVLSLLMEMQEAYLLSFTYITPTDEQVEAFKIDMFLLRQVVLNA